MRREFITTLWPDIPKETLDAIMAENGRDIEAAKIPIAALTTERDGLQTRLTEATTTIEGFKNNDKDIEDIRKEVSEWKARAEQAEADAARKETDRQIGDAVESLLGGYTFTSTFARNAVADKIKGAGLKLDGGKLLGADDLIKSIQAEDAGAFAADKNPRIIEQTKTDNGGGDGSVKDLRTALSEKYAK